jgi:integrase/recombinase XerD
MTTPLTQSRFNLIDADLRQFSATGDIKQARILNPDELELFFAHVLEPKWRLIFAIAYFTGSRIGEVLKLEVTDINPGHIEFKAANNKSKKGRKVAITAVLAQFFVEYAAPKDGYLFPARHNSKTATHIDPDSIYAPLREIVKAVPEFKGISGHSFRRSYATQLWLMGYSEKAIATLLGHSIKSLKDTQRYIDGRKS